MRNFIYTTILAIALCAALAVNSIRLYKQIQLLQEQLVQVYAELQEVRYKSSEFYTKDNNNISEKIEDNEL